MIGTAIVLLHVSKHPIYREQNDGQNIFKTACPNLTLCLMVENFGTSALKGAILEKVMGLLDWPGALKGTILEKEIAIFEFQKVLFLQRPYREHPKAFSFLHLTDIIAVRQVCSQFSGAMDIQGPLDCQL